MQLFNTDNKMSLPQSILPFKPELLAAYMLSLGITFTEVLGTTGVVLGILSTIVITVSLFRMYRSQRILNEVKAELERERLKILMQKETKE